MKRRSFVTSVAASGASLVGSKIVVAQEDNGDATPGSNASSLTGYAPVNDLEMYCEIHGSGGVPLLVLHGAFGTIDMFGPLLPALAESRQVIAFELQGHGRTADVDRPLTYEQLADDTAALLRHLGIAQADVYGYSLGGWTAQQIAIRHPALVRKLIVASASFNRDGVYPEVWAGIDSLTTEVFAGSPPEIDYARLAPNPEDCPALIVKVQQLDLEFVGWPPEDVEVIAAPTLLIVGDADIVRLGHATDMFHLLGGGVPGDFAAPPDSRFAVLPGTTHVGLVERTDWLLSMITEFLDAPMPDVTSE